jgi:hypothetical protein
MIYVGVIIFVWMRGRSQMIDGEVDEDRSLYKYMLKT